MNAPTRKKREGCPLCGIALGLAIMAVGYALAFYMTFGRFHG